MLFGKGGSPGLVACGDSIDDDFGMAPRRGDEGHRPEEMWSAYQARFAQSRLKSYAMLAAPRMPNFNASCCLAGVGGLRMAQLRRKPLKKDDMQAVQYNSERTCSK